MGPLHAANSLLSLRLRMVRGGAGLSRRRGTGLALIPILEDYFGVGYGVALAVVIVQSLLVANAPTVFGDPYCHGWITPSIPLVLAAIAATRAILGETMSDSQTTLYVVQMITAMSLLCAATFLFGGITGLGRLIVEQVPVPLKAGIIFGAAVSSFMHKLDPEVSYLYQLIRFLQFLLQEVAMARRGLSASKDFPRR